MTKDWDPVTPVAVGHLLCLERRETVQKSKARRRLALKTSALGLAGTLALFVGSIVGLASPAQATAVDQTMTIPFSCTGGSFAGTDRVAVKITTPDTVPTGQKVAVTWEFTSIKTSQVINAGTTLAIEADLDVTGVTETAPNWDPEPDITISTQIQVGQSPTVPQKKVELTPSGTTPVVVKPLTGQSLKLIVASSAGTDVESTCTAGAATPASLSTTVGGAGGGGTGGDTVSYKCATQSSGDPKDATITVAMTMPTAAKANEEQTVPATYTGGQLTVPTGGFTTGAKFIATASVSGAGVSGTSVTAEAALTTLTAGSTITFPSVSFKVKPTTAGTVTLKASDLYFGTSTSVYQYKCTVQATPAPKSHSFTVTAASTSPSPSPSPSTSTSAKPTRTVTATVTQTPVGGGNGKVTKTPKGAAETGGGGDMGPDGRMFVLTGSLVVLAAAAGGLVLRRRSVSRG
ncbi:hypothetical protein [Nonomuraea roseola]|uniref:Gram-positive cocci surface proteins LPxTG domain-containing protein n=1 Tax=Nonomuraea roseola TaxID=46179 RepID=A0ABV5PQ56_9ACTN